MFLFFYKKRYAIFKTKTEFYIFFKGHQRLKQEFKGAR